MEGTCLVFLFGRHLFFLDPLNLFPSSPFSLCLCLRLFLPYFCVCLCVCMCARVHVRVFVCLCICVIVCVQLVPKKHMTTLNKLTDIFSPLANYGNYRDLAKSKAPPLIPYLGKRVCVCVCSLCVCVCLLVLYSQPIQHTEGLHSR